MILSKLCALLLGTCGWTILADQPSTSVEGFAPDVRSPIACDNARIWGLDGALLERNGQGAEVEADRFKASGETPGDSGLHGSGPEMESDASRTWTEGYPGSGGAEALLEPPTIPVGSLTTAFGAQM